MKHFFDTYLVLIFFALAFIGFILAVLGISVTKSPGYMGLAFISLALVIREFKQRK